MYNKSDIKKLLNHCKTEGWLTEDEVKELREYFNNKDQISIFDIEAVFDIEYQLFDLDYALSIIES